MPVSCLLVCQARVDGLKRTACLGRSSIVSNFKLASQPSNKAPTKKTPRNYSFPRVELDFNQATKRRR
jgi:hypothetical protein